MAPLHPLGQDNLNEVQCKFYNYVMPLTLHDTNSIPNDTGTSSSTKVHIMCLTNHFNIAKSSVNDGTISNMPKK